MKLRIRDNSIRLRLTRGEVDTLRAQGAVSARVGFPDGGALSYLCESVPRLAAPSAAFDGKTLSVSLPAAEVDAWAGSEQVSISADTALEDGSPLALLVEKDFACLAPRAGEDESDMFAHPLAGQESC